MTAHLRGTGKVTFDVHGSDNIPNSTTASRAGDEAGSGVAQRIFLRGILTTGKWYSETIQPPFQWPI